MNEQREKKELNPNQFVDFLFTKTKGSKFPLVAVLDKNSDEIIDAIFSGALSNSKVIQDPSKVKVIDRDALAVSNIRVSEFSKAIQSCVVPTAAGSPVDILRAQDNIQSLKKLGQHSNSVLILETEQDTSSVHMNIINQFFALRKIKDLNLERVQIIISGNYETLPQVIKDTSIVIELNHQNVGNTKRSRPHP